MVRPFILSRFCGGRREIYFYKLIEINLVQEQKQQGLRDPALQNTR